MLLQELTHRRSTIEYLRVLSFEMGIYLVDVQTAEYQGLVRKADGSAQRFRSVQQIKDEFAPCRVLRAELVHESPYDEMIGNPPSANNQMALPIIMM